MTKCIKLFDQYECKKDPVPVEFVKGMDATERWEKSVGYKPKEYENITLLVNNYARGLDLMLAWGSADDKINQPPCLFLGHWNDGVV